MPKGNYMKFQKIPHWLIDLITNVYIKYPGGGRDAKVRGGHLSAVLKLGIFAQPREKVR